MTPGATIDQTCATLLIRIERTHSIRTLSRTEPFGDSKFALKDLPTAPNRAEGITTNDENG